jgi:hypothetical protein
VKGSRRSDYGTERTRAGVSFEFLLTLDAGQVLLDIRSPDGKGFCVETAPHGALAIEIGAGRLHHVAIIVDVGPNIIVLLTDGIVNDGGEDRQFGWGRFHPLLHSLNGSTTLHLSPHLKRTLIYGRAVRTSEAIASFRAVPSQISTA